MAIINESFNNLKNALLANRDANVQPGSVINDVFLVPTATELTNIKSVISFVVALQSFDGILNLKADTALLTDISEAFNVTITDVQNLISLQLEHLVNNYSITRKPASPAAGLVQFGRSTEPTGVELNQVIDTSITVRSSSNIVYAVTTDTPVSSYVYDQDLRAYIVNTPVEAVTPGTIGNATEGTILTMVTTPVGFEFVTNQAAFTNGTDLETDEQLISRTRVFLSGNNIGTTDGIKKLVLNNSYMADVYVANANSEFLTRDRNYGGAVDVYLLTKQLSQTVETIVYSGELNKSLTNQPVDRIVTITGTRSLSPITFTPGTDYLFVKDDNPTTMLSSRATDGIAWIVGQTPDVGSEYTITYIYDSNVQSMQTLINLETNNIFIDTLVRQGLMVPVDINCQISVKPGYLKDSVVVNASNNLTEYISNLIFGEILHQSDVIAILEATEGVENVAIPMIRFQKTGTTIPALVDQIEPTGREYIRLENLTIS